MLQIEYKPLKIPTDWRLTRWLFTQCPKELNPGPPRTNPDSGRVEDLK